MTKTEIDIWIRLVETRKTWIRRDIKRTEAQLEMLKAELAALQQEAQHIGAEIELSRAAEAEVGGAATPNTVTR